MRRRARVTTSAHALGSPARGAVAAHSAVTEGLCITWVRRNNITSQPTQPPTVGAGFHARPALVEGLRGFARKKWCAGCARGIAYVGLWTPPNAPHQPWVQSATPAIRNHPTPAIPRTRGVEDAAPYGRVRDVGISITVSRCVNAANLRPPLGSPERGAVTALCAVTEGLVQRGYNADAYRRGGLPRPPGVGLRSTSVRP